MSKTHQAETNDMGASIACDISSSVIVTTSRLSEFVHIITSISTDTLVIFDIDNVLIMPTEEYTLGRNSYRTELWSKLKRSWSKEQLRDIESGAIKRAEVTLVDTSIVTVLDGLHARQIPTIALTSINTGRYGVIECWEDLQIARLHKCGIIFTVTPFPDTPVTSVIAKNGDVIRPVCKAGVIVTDNAPKGEVLRYFLELHSYSPKKIVFIDDKLENLLSLKTMSEECEIEFYGFHYTAVQAMSVSYIDEIEKRREEYRFKALEEKGVWLNNAELALYIDDIEDRTHCLGMGVEICDEHK